MTRPRTGSLCTGYGGLDLAVEQSSAASSPGWPTTTPARRRSSPTASRRVPNLGDITAVDWAAVEPVDVLTAGFPCQDVSCAGGRAGLREGNRTGVWAHVARAIDALRPSLVVLENVRGLLSAGADSDMEPCPWCLGDTGDEHALRACGAVLGDLADLGYDAEWAVVSAADAGAPHRRERVFIIAWPAADTECADDRQDMRTSVAAVRQRPDSGMRVHADRCGSAPVAEDPDRAARDQRRLPGPGEAESGRSWADARRPGGTPAPADTDRERVRADGRAAHGDAGVDRAEHAEPARGRSAAPADTERDGQSGRAAGGPGAADEPGQGSRATTAGPRMGGRHPGIGGVGAGPRRPRLRDCPRTGSPWPSPPRSRSCCCRCCCQVTEP